MQEGLTVLPASTPKKVPELSETKSNEHISINFLLNSPQNDDFVGRFPTCQTTIEETDSSDGTTAPSRATAFAIPEWCDSVGHYEGDTLVIDTVGVKVDEFTSIDRFGTPQTEAMHIVERYRPINGARARADVAKYENSEGTIGGRVDGYDPAAKKGLRLEVTMEDPKVFTAPLTGVVTYLPLRTGWREYICADNPVEHYKGEWIGLPTATHPDF